MMARKLKRLFFLSCNSEGYIFVKYLSSYIWSSMAQNSFIKLNVLLKRDVLHNFRF